MVPFLQRWGDVPLMVCLSNVRQWYMSAKMYRTCICPTIPCWSSGLLTTTSHPSDNFMCQLLRQLLRDVVCINPIPAMWHVRLRASVGLPTVVPSVTVQKETPFRNAPHPCHSSVILRTMRKWGIGCFDVTAVQHSTHDWSPGRDTYQGRGLS